MRGEVVGPPAPQIVPKKRQWLQQLMRFGLLRGAFRPAEQVCMLRSLSRQLGFHPHVHVCMPAAAFGAKERLWRTKVQLSKVFAAKVRAALADAGFTLPAGLPER